MSEVLGAFAGVVIFAVIVVLLALIVQAQAEISTRGKPWRRK